MNDLRDLAARLSEEKKALEKLEHRARTIRKQTMQKP